MLDPRIIVPISLGMLILIGGIYQRWPAHDFDTTGAWIQAGGSVVGALATLLAGVVAWFAVNKQLTTEADRRRQSGQRRLAVIATQVAMDVQRLFELRNDLIRDIEANHRATGPMHFAEIGGQVLQIGGRSINGDALAGMIRTVASGLTRPGFSLADTADAIADLPHDATRDLIEFFRLYNAMIHRCSDLMRTIQDDGGDWMKWRGAYADLVVRADVSIYAGAQLQSTLDAISGLPTADKEDVTFESASKLRFDPPWNRKTEAQSSTAISPAAQSGA